MGDLKPCPGCIGLPDEMSRNCARCKGARMIITNIKQLPVEEVIVCKWWKVACIVLTLIVLFGCDTSCDEEEVLWWETDGITIQPVTTCK